MRSRLLRIFAAGLLTATLLRAQDARYFRISGPAPSGIVTLQRDGSLVWSNALAGTNYTIQTATSLLGASNWVDYIQIPVTNSFNTNWLIDYHSPAGMALIPAGSFTMGDNFNESWGDGIPLHTVYISAFYMDKYDVTYALWQQVYSWAITHGYSFDNPGSGKATNHPVNSINWYDCVKWCNARSEMEGRTPAYYTSADQITVYRTGQVNVDNSSVKWTAGYRLPTEAEWEKAARGGASGQRFPWGNTISWTQANYYAYPSYYAYDASPATGYHPTFATGAIPYTSPVGYFAPNNYGLCDMAGNVMQWVWDWYGSYGGDSQTDPHGPLSSSYRIYRGGNYYSDASYCRTALRINQGPLGFDITIGFRSALPASK